MAEQKIGKGFTLVELMTTVAILSLIVAMSIPIFLRYRLKAIRAEAIISLGAIGMSQEAFYASKDYYYCSGCPCGGICSLSSVQIKNENNMLGMGSIAISPHGYIYDYSLRDIGVGQAADRFYVTMTANLDDDAILDILGYQVSSVDLYLDGPQFPYPDREIVIISDDITNSLPAASPSASP